MAKVLIGFMGCGKSTIARLLDSDFVDMDAVLEETLGMSISAYFDRYGETAFRREESKVLKAYLNQDVVLSTGGGIVMSVANCALLAQHQDVIYLQAAFDVLYERLSQDTQNQRPLFLNQSKESLRELYAYREPLYRQVATRVITVAGKTPEEIVEMIRCG